MEFERIQFEKAAGLWREWNEKINVVSRKDIDNLFDHHIIHSLAIAEYLTRLLQSEPGDIQDSFLDVGTGGGFPGIPLAMVLPNSSFTLCDSIGKKVKVAGAVAEGLGLENVRTANCRAEQLPGEFDWIVSRAVTSLENFYPWVRGKYRKGILYLKGGDVMDEISAMCSKFRLKESKIHVWEINEWLKDDYFKEKFVIHIEK